MPSLTSSTSQPPPPPSNPHLADPLLQPFLGPSFDPTAYLNNVLPPLSISSSQQQSQSQLPTRPLSVADLSSRTQKHIAQLNAQTTRLSTILTELTDAILRSGPRLAYSVELLRGEANALADAMADTLAGDIKEFVPGGLSAREGVAGHGAAGAGVEANNEAGKDRNNEEDDGEHTQGHADSTSKQANDTDPSSAADPPDLARLRSLHHVRAQLQSVITTFDAALSWPLPPSSLSLAQSLVSVSAPQTSSAESASLEERGQAAQATLRDSVTDLLLAPDGRSAGPEGVIAAEARVAELRALANVWRGTAEEKARVRFVEGLEKMVAERRAEEEKKGALKGVEQVNAEAAREEAKRVEEGRKGGLFGGLRRLRDEIYLD